MQQAEVPLRFMHELAQAATENTSEMVTEGIEDHESRMHIPPKRTDPVQAIPFAFETIGGGARFHSISPAFTRDRHESPGSRWGYRTHIEPGRN